MSTIRQTSGISFALKFAAKKLARGIGMKKRLAKAVHGGQSPLIHSYSTFNRYLGVAKQFTQYCKEKGVNKIHNLSEDVVLAFFRERKIAFGLSEKTIKVNLCATEKFLGAIGRSDLSATLRERFSEIYAQGTAPGRTEYFANPAKVINYLKNEGHRCIAKLQYLTGARVGDTKKIKTDMLLKKVFVAGSKGGKNRTIDFSDREETLIIIDQLCDELHSIHIPSNGGWQKLREGYYADLRQAVQRAGEIYTGAHAFRATYAHERREELIDRTFSEKEADKIVSQELGHNRPAMGRYYSM